MTSTAATTPSPVQAPAPGTYQLDVGQSVIAFSTRHLFGLGQVDGTFAAADGVVTVPEDPQDSTVVARAAAATFSTGDPRRDRLITGRRFLDTGTHAHLSYRSSGLSSAPDGTWTLHGELTALGQAAPLDLTVVSLRQDGDGLHLQATGTVDRYAHGLTAARGLAARRLQVTITARATR